MSILYDEGQEAIATESNRILEARTDTERLLSLLEDTGQYDEVFWKTAVEQGWTALPVSENFDGLGLGLTELGLVAQAAGRTISGAPFLTPVCGVAHALQHGPSSELQQKWLPKLAKGETLAAVAFAEKDSALPKRPSVMFKDGVLEGMKPGVPGALRADIVLVWASTPNGPALMLAQLDDAAITAVETYDNSRLNADIEFRKTPATTIAEGAAAEELAMDVLSRMAIVTAHEQVGGAESLLEKTRDYALVRKAFGQSIGSFQSIKHRLAELYGLIEIARANCIHAAAVADNTRDRAALIVASADARLSATDAYDTAARDSIQIHGGIGVTWEQGLHLHMRRARTLAIEQGNMLFWEDVLVDQLIGEDR